MSATSDYGVVIVGAGHDGPTATVRRSTASTAFSDPLSLTLVSMQVRGVAAAADRRR
jgi:hypothetical protein